MRELRSVLERVAERVGPPEDAFERLAGLRHRAQRNRRVGAGLVALAVAAGGFGIAWVAFPAARPVAPAGSPLTSRLTGELKVPLAVSPTL